MKSLRIAHISDTHLGYKYSVLPHRDDDFAESWLYACQAIVDSSPHLIIHSGDVFHSHRPDWKALTAFSQGLDILKELEVPIFVIAGNHDTSGVASSHTVFTFTSNIHPYVVSTNDSVPSSHYVPDLDVDVVLVPHRALLNPNLEAEVQLLWDTKWGETSILVSHGSISKEENPAELGSIVIPHTITEHDWNYMAFGHLHMAQPYGQRGWYAGSTERCGWSDILAEPAWTLVEIGEDKSIHHSQMPVPHMPFIQLPNVECAGFSPAYVCQDLVDRLETIGIPEERCHIRLKALNISPTAKRQLENMLRRAMGKHYPNAVISINMNSEIPMFLTDFEGGVHSDLKPITEMFKDFVEERQYEDITFSEKFLETGLELLSREQKVGEDE